MIETVFESFICFFTKNGIKSFINWLRSVNIDSANKYCNIFEQDHLELQEKIQYPYQETNLLYVNTFLWKQLNGEIDNSLRLKNEACFENTYEQLLWFIHRFMFYLEYPGILEIKYRDHAKGIYTSYRDEIERYIDFYCNNHCYKDDDYFTHLALNLNVIGCKLKDYPQYNAVNFIEYIIDNIDKDPRLGWIRLVNFTLLAYDLSYPTERTWPVFREILHRNQDGFNDYPAYIIAIRMFGDIARKELRENENVERLSGYEMLELLSQ